MYYDEEADHEAIAGFLPQMQPDDSTDPRVFGANTVVFNVSIVQNAFRVIARFHMNTLRNFRNAASDFESNINPSMTKTIHRSRRIHAVQNVWWNVCPIQQYDTKPSTQRHLQRIATNTATMNGEPRLSTATLPVDARNIGTLKAAPNENDLLDSFSVSLDELTPDTANLLKAAEQLKNSDIPVAFPTETVYGLGADATRSAAVNGIYKAKQRPSDNPLIVHFASLEQLRKLLSHGSDPMHSHLNGHATDGRSEELIPKIYHPLISRFWPGPLTIILPNPTDSLLAPEVTAGLGTFGARIPRNILALALIKQADVPVAAPSANASTKPSPTAAEHVAYDLDGRIETIIDGGPCDVGVESTVVDGLSNPPLVLRPGGVSIEQLRSCSGWEATEIGYKNAAEQGSQPKAPGMKYRHYSPKAPVILYEIGKSAPTLTELRDYLGPQRKLGVITTKRWRVDPISTEINDQTITSPDKKRYSELINHKRGFAGMLQSMHQTSDPGAAMQVHQVQRTHSTWQLAEIPLGSDIANIARGIFAALRELDREQVDAIFVEGIDDLEGDTAAAVMNRLRKAAQLKVAG